MSKQNQHFPATSIGRSQGARLQSTSSHEAHPLLSASPTTPEHSSFTSATTAVNGNPRYVPYTPRQRVAPTATTTGTTVHPSSPQGYQGDATSKLQLMNMKAAAQSIGLDTGTVGWAMLEKLVSENDQSEEWADIWNVLTSGKATLLLPLEQFSNEKFTPEYFRDHIVLYDGPSRRQAQIVTFSGLRGVLDDERLTFRSTIHTSSKIFQDLVSTLSRPTAVGLLPSLPLLSQNVPPSQYPIFTVSSYSPSLPLPPKISTPGKPPLPPRPANRTISTTSNASSSRISNPFASLFGSSNVKIPTASVSSSPPASLRSFDSSHDSSIEVSAFAIDRKISRKDVARDINKTLKQEIKQALASVSSPMNNPMPGWVVERVHEFTVSWYPFVEPQPKKLLKGQSHSEIQATNNGYVVNNIEETPQDAAEALQDFYISLEQDMRAGGNLFLSRRKERDEKEKESDLDDEKARGRKDQEKMESEIRVREVMEVVETTICSLFYDRLFMQPHSDDSSHDEALSNRVAALNMLDLTLEHLDINVGAAGPELDLVVEACGTKLMQLDLCRSPAEKAAILVAAHQIIVDGLSRLPPISLKPEQGTSPTTPLTARPPSKSPIVPLKTIPPSVPIISLPSVSPDSPTSPLPLVGGFSSPPETATINKSSEVSAKKRPPPLPLTTETPIESTPVSGDVLLPMIIFSVVKANPPHLVSNLLYTQRFRNQSLGGEESYCLVNLLAVAEFLENVDLAALGLGDKAMSTADLTPLPLSRSPKVADMALLPVGLSGGLRGRVEQQVDAIAGSAGKVIGGVVDSSFGILRSFMPNNLNPDEVAHSPDGSSPKAGFGLLKRERGFSIASIAASLPGRGPKSISGEETGQQLVTVSRPASVRSRASLRAKADDDESQDEGSHVTDGTEDSDESEVEDEEEDEGAPEVGDTRSIKSFESMMSEGRGKKKSSHTIMMRKSLSDRLAHMSALAGLKGSPPTSRRSSLLLPPAATTSARPSGSPASSRPSSPFRGIALKLAPPVQRFVDCTPDDLRLSEVGELLRDYRRLVEGIRSVGGFDE